MGQTALQVHGEELGAARVGEYATGDYRGATTAARFGDPQGEFAALRSGCGIYDLGFRAKISLTGGDRVRWLNGMVTNNIRDLAVGRAVYAFLLNPQGHILGDFFAHNRGESIAVDTDCSQVEKILATFDHYIIMDDVEVTNLSEQLTALGIAGPNALSSSDRGGIRCSRAAAVAGAIRDVARDGLHAGAGRACTDKDEKNISIRDLDSARQREATLGRAASRGGCTRGVRGARVEADRLGYSDVWRGHSRARLAAGDRAGARSEFQ